MKDDMNELDSKIRQALSDEDQDIFEREQGVIELVIETFKSQTRWLTMLSIVGGVVVMIFAAIMAVQFFEADTTRDQTMYATLFIAAFFSIGIMKVWFWMQMDRVSQLREIKRLELQIARLAQRVHKS